MFKSNNRPLILVTNDDGHRAKGLLKLSELASEFGNVLVMAASESQSGKSHSITIKDPIRYMLKEQQDGFVKYVLKGTPADGVKLALNSLLDRKPDLILSGINHGTNSSSSVVYSGTMAAAIEGAIHHIPSIGLSILDYSPDADFNASEKYIRKMIGMALSEGMPPGICMNVNIPAVPENDLKGIKVCRQTNGYWSELFEIREDPRGGQYAWLSGSFINREPGAEGSDEWALANNYISMVPIKTDFTAYELVEKMGKWEANEINNEKEQNK